MEAKAQLRSTTSVCGGARFRPRAIASALGAGISHKCSHVRPHFRGASFGWCVLSPKLAAVMALEPGATLGAYRIIERAGKGGMATVYKAYQPALDRHVAIKVLPETLGEDEAFRSRFELEAKTVARLRHPSIVAVHDFGTQGALAYIVTELVEGGTLADRLGTPIPLPEVVKLLAPIASALDYAHQRGVLHRDVKPSNILLAADGTPVLSDFGLAKMLEIDNQLTRASAVV